MSRKPLLFAVPHDWDCIAPVLSKLSQGFEKIVHGNAPEAFVAEKHSAAPIVLLIGGTGSHEVAKEVLSWRHNSTPRLQWIHSYWAGVDAFGVAALADELSAVPFTNARSVFAPMLAEHVLLATLYFNRNVPRLQEHRKQRRYERFPSTPGCDLSLGIIGYGDIGRHVAEAAIKGLHLREVKGLKTRMTTTATHDDLGVTILTGDHGLDEILTSCDIVCAVLPSTPQTTHMIRREHFAKMKPSAIFINIGRGSTVIEDDLVDAIQAKEIRGAALDVFETEPLPPTSRLWDLRDDQLLLSPHNADISSHSYTDAVEDFVKHATAYLRDGSLPEYRVDPRRGY